MNGCKLADMSHEVLCLEDQSHESESLLHRGGHWGLRYCGIALFFKRYFGNFDFNVQYCGII